MGEVTIALDVAFSIDGFNQFCSAVAAEAGAGFAVDFFRLRMMIVISGTISNGNTPFKGWWIIPDNSDCSARASSWSASIDES